MSNNDGLDDRGRTRTEAGIDNAAEAICERLDRLVELAEQGEQSRQEAMRRMQAGMQEAVGTQNTLLTGLQTAIQADDAAKIGAVRNLEARVGLLEAKARHTEELLDNARIQ